MSAPPNVTTDFTLPPLPSTAKWLIRAVIFEWCAHLAFWLTEVFFRRFKKTHQTTFQEWKKVRNKKILMLIALILQNNQGRAHTCRNVGMNGKCLFIWINWFYQFFNIFLPINQPEVQTNSYECFDTIWNSISSWKQCKDIHGYLKINWT